MAKYKQKYTKKKILDGTNYLGNPNITNDLAEEEPSQDYGQYVATGTALTGGTANYMNTYSDPNATTSDKSAAARQGVAATASTISPVVGGIIGMANTIAAPIKKNAEEFDENGNLKKQKSAQAGAIVGNFLSPSTLATTIGEGKWSLNGKKYTDSLERDEKARLDALNYIAPVDNKDYQQDTAWQKLNNQTQMRMGGKLKCEDGGNLTQYEGYKHEQGGIPIGQNSEVETGETRGLENTASKDYIYSDKLRVPGKKYTFAKMSKMIENKHSKRDNDKLSSEQKEREINDLMNSQEEVRMNMMKSAYKKAYGGELNPNEPIGRQKLTKEPVKTFPFYQEQDGKYYTGNMNMTPTAFSTADRSGKQKLPYHSEISLDEYNKYKGTTNMFQPYRTKEYIENTTIPTFAYGGGLYGQQNAPFISAEEKDRLQYEKDLKQAEYEGQSMNSTNPFNQQLGNTQFPDQMQLKQVDSVIPDNVQKKSFGNNFDSNSIYNVGNFMGAAYDIGRGIKGGDPVNYDRVTPEIVNPDLVNYQSSRDMQRRDIKEGFKGVQQELRNINNPAAYLSLMTQNAGSRDKTISDSIAKSYENELNTNSTIKGRVNEFNAQAKNQSKYFNASTQRAELDARQAEKDVSKNILSTGLYNAGMALSQTGSDKNMTAQDKVAIEAIGQKYRDWKYDGKTNKWKFGNKTKTTAELINE